MAYPCFAAAKSLKKNPAEFAIELAAKIGPSDLIAGAKAVGPYVNFSFKNDAFADAVIKNVTKMTSAYGASKQGEGKSVVIEGAQPNTHKEFHIGHIRNVAYPLAIYNVLKASGYKTTFASYIGDIGAHVAKALWGYKKFAAPDIKKSKTRAKDLSQIYIKATAESEDNEDIKKEIAEVQQKLEARDPEWTALWKETRQWSLDYFADIFAELGLKPDVTYYESEVEGPGKEIVQKMLTDGKAEKSDGAVIINLEDEDLSVCLLLKSDGSSLYSTKDLALAFKKEEDYAADRYIIVVDVRQSFYFQQIFATLKHLGFQKQISHLSYDFVKLPEGTMSSRKGTFIAYTDLRDKMREELEAQTKSRREDWSDKKIKETAEALQRAALTFTMLRQDPESIITIDIKESISFEGFTGPYILYTAARIESIKNKYEGKFSKIKLTPSKLTNDLERQLVRKIASYPDLIARVSQNFKVSEIATWTFELAKLFNEYYHEVRILGGEDQDQDQIQSRLLLAEAVRQNIENAMAMLAIPVLKEM